MSFRWRAKRFIGRRVGVETAGHTGVLSAVAPRFRKVPPHSEVLSNYRGDSRQFSLQLNKQHQT
jgi:hypothetical protein